MPTTERDRHGRPQLPLVGSVRCLAHDNTQSDSPVSTQYLDQGVISGGTSYYYVQDNLDSVRELVTTSGSVAVQYDYDPYRNPTTLNGSAASDTGVERSPRPSGFGIGIGPNLSSDILYFVWNRCEVRQGYIHSKFFCRKYYCKSDDPCSAKEWVEIRDDGVEQDAFLDVTHEGEYAGVRPSGYTTSTP